MFETQLGVSHKVSREALHPPRDSRDTTDRQWSNQVSHEMEEFLDKLRIKHKRTIPLWPRANGEEERQNKSLLKAMRVAHAEGKPWQRELQKHLLAYRLTPHCTTGVSPAELLYGRRIQTKLP